jgi:hypothetical protein
MKYVGAAILVVGLLMAPAPAEARGPIRFARRVAVRTPVAAVRTAVVATPPYGRRVYVAPVPVYVTPAPIYVAPVVYSRPVIIVP